ncbi:hypothetical protein ACFW5P_06975 [Streptomyces rochei]|uniref:hypothetical protein n=1 Tax=Streptomyces rochei TaxID=1928 RepID=UPI00367E401C
MAAERNPAEGDRAGRDPAGQDALLAAITGEPLPPGAGADARDEHRAAVADVALLRAQLDVLGRALSEPVPEPRDAAVARRTPAPRPRRRTFRLALGVLATACAGTVVMGLGWLVAQGAGGTGDDAASGKAASGAEHDAAAPGAADREAGLVFGTPRYLACARLVAEGTVTGAEPVPGTARHRITLRVTHAYEPEPEADAGPGTGGAAPSDTAPVTFLLDDATARLGPGDRVMVGVPRQEPVADTVITGDRDIATARARVTAALPESRTLTCE